MKIARFILSLMIFAVVSYGLGMIIVRLSLTQTAYSFEEAKSEERELREEQVRLRARISERLSPRSLQRLGFAEPQPGQIVELPILAKKESRQK